MSGDGEESEGLLRFILAKAKLESILRRVLQWKAI
jgi:hypothetical protein